jgi:hypothetical protein
MQGRKVIAMHILLVDQGGREKEALLLAGSTDRVRVMMPGRADVDEFRLIDGNWRSESGAAVEFAAVMPIAGAVMGRTEEPVQLHAAVAF